MYVEAVHLLFMDFKKANVSVKVDLVIFSLSLVSP